MKYQPQLDFLRGILEKCRIGCREVRSWEQLHVSPELPLWQQPEIGAEEDELGYRVFDSVQERVLYKYTDRFLSSYVYLRLPETTEPTLLLIGPYQSVELTRPQLLEQAEKAGVPPQLFGQMEIYYASIPLLSDERTLFAPLQVFCESIWGSENAFSMTDINRELSAPVLQLTEAHPSRSPEETAEYIRLMEQRYAYENELMQAVSQGLTQKAELLLMGFSKMSFARRLADPVRDLKNYCIIMNTLLRKAAENGGVHPVYLDKLSSDFARRIEDINSTEAVKLLMDEIFRAYCRLVKKHATKQYSPLVQKVVIHIDAELAGDLSLKALAERLNVNASYLSTLFKKETGTTITDYVNQKRVKLAARVLSTTKLQIQTVAQHCGIADVNYFSKMFKKYSGMTPKEYRRSVQGTVAGK